MHQSADGGGEQVRVVGRVCSPALTASHTYNLRVTGSLPPILDIRDT